MDNNDDPRWPKLDQQGVARAVATVSRGIDSTRPLLNLPEMDEDAESLLLYVENACVEASGMLCRDKLNQDDLSNLKLLVLKGFARIEDVDPASFPSRAQAWSHRATLTDRGWNAAHALRRERAGRPPRSDTHAGSTALMMDERRKAN